MNCRCYSVDEVILIISRRIYYEAEDFRLFGGTQEWTAFNFYRRCKVVLRSRSDIANKLGVTPQYVSRILSGNTNFSFKSVAEIERKLGISCMEAAMAYHLPHQPRRHCSQTHQSGYRIPCEAKTLNSLKILQEFSKIPELTPRILENPTKFLKYLLNFRSILTIRGLLMAYITRISVCLCYMCY